MKDIAPRPDEDDTPSNCKCGTPGKPLHSCPYKEDIDSDPVSLCNCCDECRRECLSDI